jgi:TolA-binding protein
VALLRAGMGHYDATEYPAARVYFRKLRATSDPEADDGAFFYAATFFRESNWLRARHEFKRLLRDFPRSRWVPAAYWHIASCEKNLGHTRRARRTFALVVRRFPSDPSTMNLARRELASFESRREGVLVKWWRRVRRG